MDEEGSRGPAGVHPGRGDDGPERGEQVVDEVGDHGPPLVRIGDRAERRQDPGVVERELAGARAAQDVDEGEA